MGLFKKDKNEVIRFDQNLCKANADDNEVLFVRVDGLVTRADARFEVPFTHNALLIKGGGDVRYYKSGTYDVFEDKREIKDWKSGCSVQVVYIPKDTRVLIKWGTPNRIQYRDKASSKVITVGARGEFDITVTNPELFFRVVVGNQREFNLQEFRKRFGETVAGEFADIFLKIVDALNLTYDQFDLKKKEIGNEMGAILDPEFQKEWGLGVRHFKIAAFDLNQDDMEAIEDAAAEKVRQEQLKQHLAELERLDDKQWEREKYLRQLELQDRAAYYEVLKVMGDNEIKEVELKCPNCNTTYKPTDKFCPNCGKRVTKEPIICPDCGKSNESTAIFCANCGKRLVNKEN